MNMKKLNLSHQCIDTRELEADLWGLNVSTKTDQVLAEKEERGWSLV